MPMCRDDARIKEKPNHPVPQACPEIEAFKQLDYSKLQFYRALGYTGCHVPNYAKVERWLSGEVPLTAQQLNHLRAFLSVERAYRRGIPK